MQCRYRKDYVQLAKKKVLNKEKKISACTLNVFVVLQFSTDFIIFFINVPFSYEIVF
jgi:hypothetical protein